VDCEHFFDGYRANPAYALDVVFAAHEAGASKTRLRKATGRKAEEITTALKAGQLSPDTRAAAGDLARELDLEDLALLAEFDDDPGAVSRILDACRRGYPAEYVAERIRRDRAEAAEQQRIIEELRAAGFGITGEVPPGGARLSQLRHDGEELTPEAHATCPGRGVYFPPWNMTQPVHYCTSPDDHGHIPVSQITGQQPDGTASASDAGGMAPCGSQVPPPEEPPNHARRLVIEGNKAWDAAGQVRKRWLAEVLFARRSAPREAAAFVARQLLTMPEPLRTSLTIAPGRASFGEVTRQNASAWLEICDTAPASRLPLLMLAPIAVTYEYAMTESLGRATWRTDHTYSPCPRTEAGRYLAFLASLGYQLAPIEQAVADGVPYTGDHPGDQLPGGDADGRTGGEPTATRQPDSGATGPAMGPAGTGPAGTGSGDAEPGNAALEDAEPEGAEQEDAELEGTAQEDAGPGETAAVTGQAA
jgi:ParB family chromosome partitioning protein